MCAPHLVVPTPGVSYAGKVMRKDDAGWKTLYAGDRALEAISGDSEKVWAVGEGLIVTEN